MVIQVDVNGAFRYPSELEALARAVVAANSHDESDWIEWKSQVDLTTSRTANMIAQNILAFANRNPEVASRYAQGHGYLMLGVEPGNLVGVATVDPATLTARVAPYVDPRISWRIEYLPIDGKTIAIIVVDPPMPGSPIYTSRRQDERGRPAGTVFVRRQGASEQASPQDIEMLTARALPVARSLDLELVVDHGLEVAPNPEPVIEQLAAQRRGELLEARYEPPAPGDESADTITRLREQRARRLMEAGIDLTSTDERNPEQYAAEVDAYTAKLKGALGSRVRRRWLRDPRQQLRLRARTPGMQHFAGVHLRLSLRGPVLKWEDDLLQIYLEPTRDSLPFEPDPLGTPGAHYRPERYEGLGMGMVNMPEPPRIPLGWEMQEVDGGVDIRFDEFDVRAGEGETLSPVFLVVTGQVGDAISMDWTLTSADSQGVLQGHRDLVLAETTFDIVAACNIDDPFG